MIMSKSLAGCQHIENILDSVFHIFIVFNFSKTETFLQCSDIVIHAEHVVHSAWILF